MSLLIVVASLLIHTPIHVIFTIPATGTSCKDPDAIMGFQVTANEDQVYVTKVSNCERGLYLPEARRDMEM